MKIGILTNEAHTHQRKNTVGSSRIRGTWIVNNWDEAEMFKIGIKYDVVIFQKAYFTEYMKVFDGIKILDMCDPDWLDDKKIKETIDLCDAVTTSSEELAKFIKQITDKPVVFIPDRVDMKEHTQKKNHKGPAKGVVWFGYHTNQKTIDGTLSTLKILGLSLTVVSDMPYQTPSGVASIDKDWIKYNLTNIKFDPDTINDDIIAYGDIVINPRLEYGKFKYKSDNKTFIAWALGMPVAKTSEDLEKFIDESAREKEARERLGQIDEELRVNESIHQYKTLIDELLAKRG